MNFNKGRKFDLTKFIVGVGAAALGYYAADFVGGYIPGGNTVQGAGKIGAGALTATTIKGSNGALLGLGMAINGGKQIADPLVAGALGGGGALALNGLPNQRMLYTETTGSNYDARVADAYAA